MAKKKRIKSEVIKDFKKNNKQGKLIEYKVGEYFYSTNLDTIEYFKQIKLIK